MNPDAAQSSPDSRRTVVIVSHVVHYSWGNQLHAYSPYAKEIDDVWAHLFQFVVIAAPCRREPPPADCCALVGSNIFLRPQKETGGETVGAKVRQLFGVPRHVWMLSRAMRRTDAIHVRCPGNLGLLGVILAPLFSKALVAKYAGQWTPYPGEPWTWRLQRTILRSPWWSGPVMVYGEPLTRASKIVSSFSSIMTTSHIVRARQLTQSRSTSRALRTVFVGRLTRQKNVHVLLDAAAVLRREGLEIITTIVGDGPERSALERQAANLDLGSVVRFAGAVPFEQTFDFYRDADVLVLASDSEGWPKALTEAMTFGLICVGSRRGLVPNILGDGRGIIVPPGDMTALADVLRNIAGAPENYHEMRCRAAEWAKEYSVERLRQTLGELLGSRWLGASEEPTSKSVHGICHQ